MHNFIIVNVDFIDPFFPHLMLSICVYVDFDVLYCRNKNMLIILATNMLSVLATNMLIVLATNMLSVLVTDL